MLSRNLEQSLHRAIALAGEHRHEYATLEHLLLALIEDSDAVAVMKACGVDIERLRRDLDRIPRQRTRPAWSRAACAIRSRPPVSSA